MSEEQKSVVFEIHPLEEVGGHLDGSKVASDFAKRFMVDPEDEGAIPYHILTPSLVVVDNKMHVLCIATRFDVLSYRAGIEGGMQATAQIHGQILMQREQGRQSDILTASPVAIPKHQKRGFGRP